MIEKAYVVPHPPIILPAIGKGDEKTVQDTLDGMKRMAEEVSQIKPETIIISSPHAPYYRDVFFLAKGDRASSNMNQFNANIPMTVEYDTELADEIAANDQSLPIYYTEENAQDLDHGSFIPLWYIKEKYKDFKVIILGISTASGKYHYSVGKAIKEAVEKTGRKALYIASGDLSHVLKEDGPYGYKEEGPIFDEKIMDILSRAAFDELLDFPQDLVEKASQCGIDSFKIMAGAFDGRDVQAEKFSYNDDFGVGYGILSFTPGEENESRKFLEVGTSEDAYVRLARKTIETYVRKGEIIDLPDGLPEEMLKEKAGVFVTIDKFDELRGCIGTIESTTSCLGQEIIKNAISSATEDPRFYPISEDELDHLEISVDILGPNEEIHDISQLDPDNYGVIVEKDYRRGLLLPMIDGVDTAEEQVSIALRKADISPNEDYRMYRFKVIRHE